MSQIRSARDFADLRHGHTRWMVFAAQAGKTGYRWWLWVFLGQVGSLGA